MPLTLNMQFNLVMYSILAGIITGILFDIYRGIRGLSTIKLIVIIEDILFWVFAALVIFTFLLYTNYAFLTYYVYIFIILSLLGYLKFISRHFYSREQNLIKEIIKVIRVFFKHIIYPFKVIIYKITDKRK